jgi:hypothetical protein
MKRLVLVFFLMTMGLASAAGNQYQWHWVRVGLNWDRWGIEEGMADVTIRGEKFKANLYLKEKPKKIYIILKGVLKDGKLKVTQMVPELNAVDPTYAGTHYRTNVNGDSNTYNHETINLSNKQTMIGLARKLPAEHR